MSEPGHEAFAGAAPGGIDAADARVRRFNEALLEAMDRGHDLREVFAAIDPDPARYTDAGEGGGILEEVLAPAERLLRRAPRLPSFRRVESTSLALDGPVSHPALGVAGESRWLAGLRWLPGRGEEVVVSAVDGSGASTGAATPISGSPGDCLRPTVVAQPDGSAWVFFAKRVAGVLGVWVARGSRGSWTEPELVSVPGVPSLNQDAVLRRDGSVECCWQALAGTGFAIFTRRYRQGRWTEPERLSDETERNVWDPVVTCMPDGAPAYSWTSYGGTGYATAVLIGDAGRSRRRFVLGGEPGYELHPSLAVTANGELWCARDAVLVVGHGGSGPTRLRPAEVVGVPSPAANRPDGRAVPSDLSPDVRASIRVSRLEPDAATWELLDAPGSRLTIGPGALPRLAVVGGDRIGIAYRARRRLPLMLYFWDAAVEFFLGASGWGGLTTFAEADGPLEEVAIAASREGVLVAWKHDGRRARSLEWSEGFGGTERDDLRSHYGEVIWNTLDRPGRVQLAPCGLPVPDGRSVVGPLAVGESAPADLAGSGGGRVGGPAQRGPVEDSRPWTGLGVAKRARYQASVDGREYTLYWGDLHRHSLISRCTAGDEPTLDDFYRYAWDICEYDFWAVTDHAENTSAYQWEMIQKVADVLHVPGVFVPFYGFEWTGATGHQNVIYRSALRGAPIFSSTATGTSTPAGLWGHLRRYPDHQAISIPHHPGSAMVPFDWSYADEELLRLVEVFQACRGNYEADGCFRQYSDGTLPGTFVADGLARGHRFGLIASSDHGNGASYVGVLAESLTREDVFDALYARRALAATTRDIVIDFRVNGAVMGSVLTGTERAETSIVVKAYADVARVDLLRDGTVHATWQPELDLPAGWIAVPLRVEWQSREAATADWSGGLSIRGGGEVLQTPYWSPEVTGFSRTRVTWTASTRNFRSQYGAQRGGVEVTLCGAPESIVEVTAGRWAGHVELGALRETARVSLHDGSDVYLGLQRGTGGLRSLGSSELCVGTEEVVAEPHWFYARVMLVDGEMAWSSPIWVHPSVA